MRLIIDSEGNKKVHTSVDILEPLHQKAKVLKISLAWTFAEALEAKIAPLETAA
ncbi:MAG TPA: hypothetical protein VN372_00935 [Methanospirillum sp.]|nr:hypothetical protein [Methanospirillum sp.]